MNAEAVGAIGIAVTLLTQLAKFAFLPDRAGPLAVLFFAALGVALYGWSNDPNFAARTTVWSYFVGWLTTAATAAGIYGFSRATAATVATVTRATPPPTSVIAFLFALRV